MAAVLRVFPLVLRPSVVVPALLYVVICAVLWTIPLAGILHIESSMVIAAAGFFIAGLTSLVLFRRDVSLMDALGGQLLLLVVPWLMLTISLFWIPNCGYLQGFMLFVVYAIPSVILGTALAFALAPLGKLRGILWFIAISLIVAIVPVGYDFLFHPQFYTYNHVWGGLLGPLEVFREAAFAADFDDLDAAAFFLAIGKTERSETVLPRTRGACGEGNKRAHSEMSSAAKKDQLCRNTMSS